MEFKNIETPENFIFRLKCIMIMETTSSIFLKPLERVLEQR